MFLRVLLAFSVASAFTGCTPRLDEIGNLNDNKDDVKVPDDNSPTDETAPILWQSTEDSSETLVEIKSPEYIGVAYTSDTENAGKYASFDNIKVINVVANDDGSETQTAEAIFADGTKIDLRGIGYEDAAVYITQKDGVDTLLGAGFLLGGEPLTNLPVGSYTYRGFSSSMYTYNGNAIIDEDLGEFTMYVNFDQKSANLDAATDTARYTNKALAFDEAGKITGNNGTFIVRSADGKTNLDTRNNIGFFGNFNGDSAKNVTGSAVGNSGEANDFSAMFIVGKKQ